MATTPAQRVARRLRSWSNGKMRDSDVATDVRAVLAELDRLIEVEKAVLDAERSVVDTGSYEIVHVDRALWDRCVQLAKAGA